MDIFPNRLMMILFACLQGGAGLFIAPIDSWSREQSIIAGPVEAQVIRVVDGDTLLVEARPWPQQRIEVYVRLRGIDTPELRADCAQSRNAALQAKKLLAELASENPTLWLRDISGDKYFGRIVANVTFEGGVNPAEALLFGGYAKTYNGGRKTEGECAEAKETAFP